MNYDKSFMFFLTAVCFALVSHAVWNHSKKRNISAPIAMRWLDLLSHNPKYFHFSPFKTINKNY